MGLIYGLILLWLLFIISGFVRNHVYIFMLRTNWYAWQCVLMHYDFKEDDINRMPGRYNMLSEEWCV